MGGADSGLGAAGSGAGPGEADAVPRVAVIGCGVVSVVHFEEIAAIDGAELVGVADLDPATAEAAEERYGVHSSTDLESLIAEVSP